MAITRWELTAVLDLTPRSSWEIVSRLAKQKGWGRWQRLFIPWLLISIRQPLRILKANGFVLKSFQTEVMTPSGRVEKAAKYCLSPRGVMAKEKCLASRPET